MKINIYYDDLSKEGKRTLFDCGFTPTEDHKNESKPIGVLDTNKIMGL